MKLGRAEVVGRIGRGGTAEVFLGRVSGAAGFSHEVALKALHRELMSDVAFVKMFATEAKLMSRLQHPHIVSVSQLGVENGRYFMEMDYIAGPNLAFAPPSPGLACLVVEQMGAALHHAHSQQIIHRDVTPTNILVRPTGDLALTDFGLAKATISDTRTRTGVLHGRLAWMSPEQAAGKALDARSDLFSLGLVVLATWTGRAPYAGIPEAALVDAVRSGHAQSQIPEALRAVLTPALALDPAARYPDVRTFMTAFAETIHVPTERLVGLPAPKVTPVEEDDALDLFAPPAARTVVVATPKKSRALLVIATAFATALLLVLVALLVRTDSPAPPPPPIVSAAPPPPPPAQHAAVAPGYLNLSAQPWARVLIDGKQVADHTPLRHHALAPGKHTVTLENAEGKRAHLAVDIISGETTTRTFKWQ